MCMRWGCLIKPPGAQSENPPTPRVSNKHFSIQLAKKIFSTDLILLSS